MCVRARASHARPSCWTDLAASIAAINATRARFAHFHKPLLVVTGPPPEATSTSEKPTHDVHYAGAHELVAAVTAAGRVPATLCELPAPAPHDLVFEATEPNPAVDQVVAFVRSI